MPHNNSPREIFVLYLQHCAAILPLTIHATPHTSLLVCPPVYQNISVACYPADCVRRSEIDLYVGSRPKTLCIYLILIIPFYLQVIVFTFEYVDLEEAHDDIENRTVKDRSKQNISEINCLRGSSLAVYCTNRIAFLFYFQLLAINR